MAMILDFWTDVSGQTLQTQIAPLGSTLFAIRSTSFGCIAQCQSHVVKIFG